MTNDADPLVPVLNAASGVMHETTNVLKMLAGRLYEAEAEVERLRERLDGAIALLRNTRWPWPNSRDWVEHMHEIREFLEGIPDEA